MSLGVYKSTFHRVTTQLQLHWLKVLLKKKNKRKRASRIQSGSFSVSEPTSTRKLDWHVYVLWLGYPLKWPCNTTLRDFQRCASLRTMHMSYRSKTYTWNDAIRVKRIMIRGFFILFYHWSSRWFSVGDIWKQNFPPIFSHIFLILLLLPLDIEIRISLFFLPIYVFRKWSCFIAVIPNLMATFDL